MSYQVLARKWRPSKFAELVGQEHVKSALINGLTQQRLHHAYLFTGTRGVGKTTIARIFAKSLNCEVGVSAEPCGQCTTCVDVDQGRFVDLIEIDAASRTKVGDTREILDNVQYAPTKGRYKVYLIDEVHMLSRHSFNALLKTLEEPPEHVKFLLATTDPQKLPVTILSRCLQFNLQALTQKQIAEQLSYILTSEQIAYAEDAVKLLAKYAKGSMRDGLSLTDQAIAQSGQNIQLPAVQQMLGTVDVSWSQNLLSAILQNDGATLVEELQRLALQNPDLEKVLDDLLTVCHQVAMTQVLPSAAGLNEWNSEFIAAVAKQVPAQQIQVYYQILLQGKKDIKLASEPHSGFEMICLRLLAFSPVEAGEEPAQVKKNSEIKLPSPSHRESEQSSTPQVQQPEQQQQQQQQQQEQQAVEAETSALAFEPEPQATAETKAETRAETTAEAEPEPLTNSPETETAPAQASEESFTDPELAAQEAFYHELAQSQGFDGGQQHYQAEPTYEMPAQAEMAPQQPSEPEQVAKQEPTQELSQEPQQSANAAVSNPVQGQDFSSIDNPVMAILAAREAQSSMSASANEAKTANEANQEAAASTQVEPEPVIEPEPEPEPELKPIEHEEVRYAHEVDKWASLIERSGLKGLTRQLALQSAPDINGSHIELTVKRDYAHLLNDKTENELYEVVSRMAPDCTFVINKSEIAQHSPAAIQQNINENRQERAEQSIYQDEFVQTLLNEFDGKLVLESIKPL